MRSAVPLLKAELLPELEGGAELFIVETLLAHPDPTDDMGQEEEHSLAVLVLVKPGEVARRRVRAEAPLYVGGHYRINALPGDDWADAGLARLAQFAPAFVDVVVALPNHSERAEGQVLQLLDGLRSAGQHALCATVAVAQHSPDWHRLNDVLGYVEAADMSVAEGAIWLHAGIAQLSAPQLIQCVSDEELLDIWGTHTRPARLAVADAGHLRHVTGVQPGSRAAVFCLASVQLQQHLAIARDLRTAGVESPLIVSPAGLTLPARAVDGCPCVVVIAPEPAPPHDL